MTELALDYESFSEVDLKRNGLDRYASHDSTEILMMGWAFDRDEPQLWLPDQPFPKDVRRALESEDVIKRAFNAPFERVMTKKVLGIDTPIKGWRCSQVLAYMQSFTGSLGDVGAQIGLSEDKQKMKEGLRLVRKFTMPQKPTKARPWTRADELTDPEDWQKFCKYCPQDVVAETAIWDRLIKYVYEPWFSSEWELWELDQKINDRGLPVDLEFTRNAYEFAMRHKAELIAQLKDMTGLANPASPAQMLAWLKPLGYWFNDLRKETVKKVLTENEEDPRLDEAAVEVLKVHQIRSKTTPTKLKALLDRVGDDGRIRYTLQFGGAQRTQRWAGRGFQPQNLARTSKENLTVQDDLRAAVLQNDYDWYATISSKVIVAVSETVRAAIATEPGRELRVSDLSAIETCVTAWLARCHRLLTVIREGKDPYKDFGSDLYQKPYEEITKDERQNSKPAVLGCTYGLSGGELKEGKRTGLWGYAEGMGVNQTKEESHRQVRVFRESYPEIPKTWWAIEEAYIKCIETGRTTQPEIRIDGKRLKIPLRFEMRKPYLIMHLPSEHPIYYYKPRLTTVELISKRTGNPYKKKQFSYMGTAQNSRQWTRVYSHAAKVFENAVQAIARDVLKEGMLEADFEGFDITGDVHDEIITECRVGDNYYTIDLLGACMVKKLWWAPDLPLGYGAWAGEYYRKD